MPGRKTAELIIEKTEQLCELLLPAKPREISFASFPRCGKQSSSEDMFLMYQQARTIGDFVQVNSKR